MAVGADRHEQRSETDRLMRKAKASTMARPRKQASERRTACVKADLTLAEKIYVQQQAAEAGLSEAEYTRRRVLGYCVPPRAEKLAKAALTNEINRLGNQLAAIGNISNQIALYCHTDRSIPIEWSAVSREIRDLQARVHEVLERMVLSDGT